jgi:hypothetical protein
MRATLRPVMVFALIGTAAAVPAFAQSSPAGGGQTSQYATCSNKPTQADTDAAHGAYMAGKGSFDEADYTTAVNYFKDAYRRDCTKHELLVIIARAYELQGNRREAIHALETYLERVPTAQDLEVQRRHIANLKREVSEQPSASVAPAPPPPSSASVASPASASPPLTTAPGGSAAPPASLTPEPPPEAPSKGHTVLPWVVVVAGGGAFAVGAILFGIGNSDVSNAEQVCGSSHHCPSGSSASEGNSGRTNETIGVAVGAAGLGAAALGLIWHFVEPTGPAKSGRLVLTPEAGPGYAGVGVGARF